MIREATFLDLPALLDIGARMHGAAPVYAKMKFDARRLASTLTSLIGVEHGYVWVAERDGAVVGVMVACAVDHWCSASRVATEMALFVEPELRGSFIAARLIKGYLAWAHALGCSIVTAGVSTGVDEERITALYVRLGFKQLGTQLEA